MSLLSELRKSGYGCKIGHLYCGAIVYADDVSFLSPSVYALKMMYGISPAFASGCDIKFNPIECQLLIMESLKMYLNFDFVMLC